MFYHKVGVIRFQVVENNGKEKVFSIIVFRPLHVPVKLCLFVLYLTLCDDLSFPVRHFQGEVTFITCRKQILPGNVIVMPHLVI